MTGPFEETVREAMEARGMGLRELCRRAGLDPSFFSKVLAGKRSPPPDDCVRRIAEALGLDESRLIVAAGRIPREWSRLREDEDACRRVGELLSADTDPPRLSPAPGHNWKARDRGESRAPYPTAPAASAPGAWSRRRASEVHSPAKPAGFADELL